MAAPCSCPRDEQGDFFIFCSLFASVLVEEGSRSTSKHRTVSSSTLPNFTPSLDPFRSHRQNRPTSQSNQQISIHRQTTRKSIPSSGFLHCSDPASILSTPCKTAVFSAPCKIAVFSARFMSHGGAEALHEAPSNDGTDGPR
jgi:hypothetical protein